jgi:hypothetical protein|tara:strand:+ start:199 stop:405 length:207 start_codon:yes stop_codon:yes gene_type:complete
VETKVIVESKEKEVMLCSPGSVIDIIPPMSITANMLIIHIGDAKKSIVNVTEETGKRTQHADNINGTS